MSNHDQTFTKEEKTQAPACCSVFLVEVRNLTQSTFITGRDWLAPTIPVLRWIILGKVKATCTHDDIWNLSLPISWPYFFCLGFVLSQPFSSW